MIPLAAVRITGNELVSGFGIVKTGENGAQSLGRCWEWGAATVRPLWFAG